MFSDKDYIVCQVENKKVLAKVVDSTRNVAKVVDKSAAHESTKQEIVFDESNVLAWLGTNPLVNSSVYGVKVEPYHKKLALKPYGYVLLFRTLSETEKSLLVKDLESAAKRMKKLELDGIFPIEVEVREKKGMNVGYAKVVTKGEDIESTMSLHPHTFSESLKPTIYHEFGHFIWYTKMSDKYKAKWVHKFAKSVTVSQGSKSTLSVIKDDVQKNGIMCIDDYVEEYDDVASAILDYIAEYHNLNYKQLCLLSNQGYDVTEYFPSQVQLTEQEVLVTDYANKNPEEFFAESFKFWVSGDKLPKSVGKLMEKTYKAVRGL